MALTKFEVVFTKERILSASGLAIVGQMLGKSDFVKRVNRIPVNPKRSEPQIKDGDILLTYIDIRSEFHPLDLQAIKGDPFLCPSQFFPAFVSFLQA